MSDLRHIAILEPEETRRILREAMALAGYCTPVAARGFRASAVQLRDIIVLLGLQEEFRLAREAKRARFADPEQASTGSWKCQPHRRSVK